MMWEVEGIRPREYLKKTWWHCVKNDMEIVGLSQKDVQFRNTWRRKIKGATGSPGKIAIETDCVIVCVCGQCISNESPAHP